MIIAVLDITYSPVFYLSKHDFSETGSNWVGSIWRRIEILVSETYLKEKIERWIMSRIVKVAQSVDRIQSFSIIDQEANIVITGM
jgi:hypothetical protein